MIRRTCILSLLLLVLASASTLAGSRIKMASTTSTQNSGLFDQLLPLFEKKTAIKVDVVAAGSGAAIEIGKRGDADVVFVHAKEQELQAVREGFFVSRHDVMYNDFVIVGPPADDAKVKGRRSAADALKAIAASGSSFVSRGDLSGTHTREQALWKRAGIEPAGQKWYLEVGQGMEKTQRIADEKNAYTLTDRGTWLATKDKDGLDLVVVLEGDPVLFNQYGIMVVNPEKHRHANYAEAMEFVNWMISKDGQDAVAAFRDKGGKPLFIPNAK